MLQGDLSDGVDVSVSYYGLDMMEKSFASSVDLNKKTKKTTKICIDLQMNLFFSSVGVLCLYYVSQCDQSIM